MSLQPMSQEKLYSTLCAISKDGNFEGLTAAELTAFIVLRDRGGLTFLHVAAQYCTLAALPAGLLTKNALLMQDNVGDTPFIFAARFGSLNQIPEKFFTTENLINEHSGLSVLHCAAKYKTLDQIPACAFSHVALRNFDRHGQTVFHIAAEHGNVNQLPPTFVTAANMSYYGECGESPLHIAAYSAELNAIPRQLLTPSMLAKVTGEGKTVYHLAAERDCINHIPKKSLETPYILQNDNYMRTPLHYVVSGGCLDQLLGVKLPKSARAIVGNDWWNKNLDFEKLKLGLAAIKPNAVTEIELF